jgi:ribonuclease P protein subunit RPR2
MSRRRISNDKIARIADERIAILTRLSKEALVEGRKDRAQRYVTLALRICQKTRADMPEGFVYCKQCRMPLIPGINQRVRVTRARVISTCGECGGIRRRPYIREKAHD